MINDIDCYAPEVFTGKLFKSTVKFVGYNKGPNDWFPLIENTKIHEAGTFIGSISDSQIDAFGQLWVKAQSIAYPWFAWNDSNFVVSGKKIDTPLTDEQKSVIFDATYKSIPGGEGVIITKNISEAFGQLANLGVWVTDNLILILLIVLILYLKK